MWVDLHHLPFAGGGKWHDRARKSRTMNTTTTRAVSQDILALVVIVLAGACDSPRPTRVGTGSFADGTCVLPDPQPCDNCMDFSLVAQLGGKELDDGVYLLGNGPAASTVQDRLGRYWVGQGDHLKLFAPDGRYLRTIGRRGEGPGEFILGYPIAVDRHGQVHILDTENGRVLMVDEDLTFSDAVRLPAFSFEMALFPDARRYAMSSWITDVMSAGYPIHVLDADTETVASSFGILPIMEEGTRPLDRLDNERWIAVSFTGVVFASRTAEYVVDAWNSHDGSRIGRLEGPPLDDGQRVPGPYNRANPPWHAVRDIWMDASDLLWISLDYRVTDWEDYNTEVVSPSGRVTLKIEDNSRADTYRHRIDVVDPHSCAVVASSWFDEEGELARFVRTDGRVLFAELVRRPLSDPVVNIWQPRVR